MKKGNYLFAPTGSACCSGCASGHGSCGDAADLVKQYKAPLLFGVALLGVLYFWKRA
jgi:hypothetical protein